MTWWQELFLSGWYTALEHVPPEHTEQQVAFVVDALNVPPGATVLDLACGVGRHSLPLAGRGLRVVGVDYTPAYLDIAAAGVAGRPASFARGDMRRVPLRSGSVDAAINLFTSFGYFGSDEEDERVLREVARVLRPGGRFLIDVAHRDGIVHAFRARDWHETPDGLLLEDRHWNARTGRTTSDWTFVHAGERRTFTVDTRMYTCPELDRLLREAGLDPLRVWGGWDGSDLVMESRWLIVLATKG